MFDEKTDWVASADLRTVFVVGAFVFFREALARIGQDLVAECFLGGEAVVIGVGFEVGGEFLGGVDRGIVFIKH